MRYLHTMIRVLDLDATVAFFELLGLKQVRRNDYEGGRFSLVFMGTGHPDDPATVELTWNWDQTEPYDGGRNMGHLAYAVDDIYGLCEKLQAAGVVINRPPLDGRMAFVKTPDGISIELLQAGGALPIQEPWASMGNVGSW